MNAMSESFVATVLRDRYSVHLRFFHALTGERYSKSSSYALHCRTSPDNCANTRITLGRIWEIEGVWSALGFGELATDDEGEMSNER